MAPVQAHQPLHHQVAHTPAPALQFPPGGAQPRHQPQQPAGYSVPGLVPAQPVQYAAPVTHALPEPQVDAQVAQQSDQVKQGLLAILNRCQAAFANNPGEQRKIVDTQKKLDVLFAALSQGKVPVPVIAKLLDMTASAQAMDYPRALG